MRSHPHALLATTFRFTVDGGILQIGGVDVDAAWCTLSVARWIPDNQYRPAAIAAGT